MKKKIKKYQIGGGNPCGEGTIWDAKLKQCVPIADGWNNTDINGKSKPAITSTPIDPIFLLDKNNTNFNYGAAKTDNQGNVQSSSIQPIFRGYNNQILPDINAGMKDQRGDFIPQQKVIGDAIDQGFNLDSDNVYRKKIETEDKNKLWYNNNFQALNTGLDITRLAANTVNDIKNSKKERNKLLAARYKTSNYNSYETGLNNVPVYMEKGGEVTNKSTGITPNEARKILHAKELNGKPLTPEQYKLFGYLSKGNTLNFPKHQDGGMINNTGYTPGTDTFDNPYNIIPSDNITMEKTPFDVMAYPDNGQPTLMKSGGNYKFKGAKYVTEVPVKQNGGYTKRQLRKMGNTLPNQYNIYSGIVVDGKTIENPTEFQAMKNMVEYLKHNYSDQAAEPSNVYRGQFEHEAGNTPSLQNIPVAQNGGSIVDYLNSKNQDSSYNTRAQMAAKAGIKNYTGSAEQNTALLQMMRGNGASSSPVPSGKAGQKQKYAVQPSQNTQYQGFANDKQLYFAKQAAKANNGRFVLTDKSTNRTYYGTYDPKSNKFDMNNFEVLTGKSSNVDREANLSVDQINQMQAKGQNTDNIKATPVGFYPLTQNPDIYGVPGLNIGKTDIAYHTTYHGPEDKSRDKRYNNKNPNDNYVSYGCINCEKPSIENLTKFVGNSKMNGVIINSNKYYKENFDNIKANTPDTYNSLFMQNGGQADDTQEVEGVGPGEGNAELEQGEVFQSQDGDIQKVAESEPTHDDGGSIQPDVDRVLEDTSDKRKDKVSKALRVSPKEAFDITGFKPKSTVSHSKLYEKTTEYYDKKLKTLEGKLGKNLEYAKQNGGKYAQNSLQENLKILQTVPVKNDIFDKIYNHQEEVKQEHNILDDGQNQQKYGGMNKFDIGGDNSAYYDINPYGGGKTKKGRYTPTGLDNSYNKGADYLKRWDALIPGISKMDNKTAQGLIYDYSVKNNPNAVTDMWNKYGITAKGLNTDFKGQSGIIKDPTDLGSLKNSYTDGFFGVRQLEPPTKAAPVPAPAAIPAITGIENHTVPTSVPDEQTKYRTPEPIVPSTVSSPLGLSGGLGNVLGFIDASSRIPVDLEQLQRTPLRVHEDNPLPTLLQNQADYNAATQILPTNGVGFANQANLQANKYAFNDKVLGTYDSQNHNKYDAVDAANSQGQLALDQTNMGLRDQFNNRILIGKEKQREQKFEYMNGLFKAIDERNAFDKNANLMLKLSPYFDANGNFNGNDYQLKNVVSESGGNIQYITDPHSGQQFRIIYDKDGKKVSSSKVVGDNKAIGSGHKIVK